MVHELKALLKYLFCSLPFAMFESSQVLRQANKSVLAQVITKITPEQGDNSWIYAWI